MLKEIVLPEISDSVTAADVLKVLVAPGDAVRAEQPLLELETDKAVFEFPAPEAGTLKEVRVKAGDKVTVGQVLFLLEAEGAGTGPEPRRAPAKASPTPAKAPSRAPEPAPAPPAPVPPHPSEMTPPPLPTGHPGPAAPHVRRIARELGVDLSRVVGSGPKGRITDEDVRRATLSQSASAPTPAPPRSSEAPYPPAAPFAARPGDRREPMGKVRRITADTMARAWATVPQVTQQDRTDVTALEAFRKKHGPRVEKAGGKLTVTAILIKVCAEALRRFPQFNASVDMERSEVVFHEEVAVGVAVDTERGLLVPVVRYADRKTVTELAVELSQLSDRARSKRIAPTDLEGGTFTISNLGGIGGLAFSPIVYPPQVAILGVSRSSTEPLWKDGAFVPRLLLPLSLTYDHRLIDGADGARFLRWVCEALEDPWDKWI